MKMIFDKWHCDNRQEPSAVTALQPQGPADITLKTTTQTPGSRPPWEPARESVRHGTPLRRPASPEDPASVPACRGTGRWPGRGQGELLTWQSQSVFNNKKLSLQKPNFRKEDINFILTLFQNLFKKKIDIRKKEIQFGDSIYDVCRENKLQSRPEIEAVFCSLFTTVHP